jgi:hypothetical protein|tara:strand:+ start:245 stop:1483 length:1239 start_codon:yes stop_codon:yes gene_type:complete
MFDLVKYLTENKLNKSSEFENIKQQILDMVPMNEEDTPQDIQNDLLNIISQVDDIDKMKKLRDAVEVLVNRDQLNSVFLDKLVKSDYGKRILSPKTLKVPTRKNAKDLGLDKVGLLNDLTDDHFKDKGTLAILKWVSQQLFSSDLSKLEIEEYIDLISNPANLIKASELQGSGNIDDLINPLLIKNSFYQQSKRSLFDLNGKGIGKGESLLVVYGSNSGIAPSKKGDVIIDNTFIEVKNTESGGSIDSGLSSGKFDIDKFNAKFLGDLGLEDEEVESMNLNKSGKRNKGFKMVFNDPSVSEKLTVDNLKIYFTKIYGGSGGLDDGDINSIASKVYDNRSKSNKEIAKEVFPYIFKLYKEKKEFDTMVLLNPNGNYFVMGDGELPNEVQISGWMLSRGGNNQSLPVGYINLKY